MSDPKTKIEVSELSKNFQQAGQKRNPLDFAPPPSTVVALDSMNLQVRDGEFFVIVGPSGCGKTTLLRMMAGLELPTAGKITIKRESNSNRPLNNMIFQEQSIFPWMSVEDNIAYGLKMRGVPAEKRREQVWEYMRKVGLEHFSRAYPHQLSGGMKQRVSIARAFANDPEILLMDEPFAALDEQNKLLLQSELNRIWEETRKTVVFITHSIDEALTLGDRIMVMTAQPGKIKAIIEVPFPRPRDVIALKANPRYGELSFQIWELLRDEVLKSKEGMQHRE